MLVCKFHILSAHSLTHTNIDTSAYSPVTPLLFGLIIPPNSPLDRASVSLVQFAAVLFAHLLRHAPYCKDLASKIIPRPLTPLPASSTAGGAFFVPADGEPHPPPDPPAKEDPENAPQNLLALITEQLSLAFLQRSRAGVAPREAREGDCHLRLPLVARTVALGGPARSSGIP